ncbi:MAG: hypothetical protein LBV34_11295, partial [Nocardiopsaceae bacterium]|nr:hypothetical protein [Nocardiopsaceae bacterium]
METLFIVLGVILFVLIAGGGALLAPRRRRRGRAVSPGEPAAQAGTTATPTITRAPAPESSTAAPPAEAA